MIDSCSRMTLAVELASCLIPLRVRQWNKPTYTTVM